MDPATIAFIASAAMSYYGYSQKQDALKNASAAQQRETRLQQLSTDIKIDTNSIDMIQNFEQTLSAQRAQLGALGMSIGGGVVKPIEASFENFTKDMDAQALKLKYSDLESRERIESAKSEYNSKLTGNTFNFLSKQLQNASGAYHYTAGNGADAKREFEGFGDINDGDYLDASYVNEHHAAFENAYDIL